MREEPRGAQKANSTRKRNDRFDASTLSAVSRVFAREAALKVAEDGLRWIVGSGGVADTEISSFESTLGLPAIHKAQAGLIADMDLIGDAIYGRAEKHKAVAISA